MQYAYLQINKLKGNIQILFSCNLLYMMTQYAYLRNNKLKEIHFGGKYGPRTGLGLHNKKIDNHLNSINCKIMCVNDGNVPIT